MSERSPLQIVEIDIERCALTYGQSPCTATGAAGSECYNTFKTCQDKLNFDRENQTLTFGPNMVTGITGRIVFPALQSVSTNPTKISLGKADNRLGSLGKRARVTVQLKDFRWGDSGLDKYRATRSYDPETQGTFFGKLRARFPYYYGRALRVKTGEVGDNPATMRTRNYIITEWRGPDAAGNVTITAQDPLRLTDKEFAQCPKPSNGRLGADIDEGFLGDVELVPATVGEEYAASGRMSIGSEIMTYTRSGDTLTITARGVDGSDAGSHDTGDTVQECYRAENADIADVLQELLQDFAGVDQSFIPYADWQSEFSRWFSGIRLTRTIAKPEAVADLIGQMMELGFNFWWDEINQELKIRANRFVDLGETVTDLTDNANFLDGSTATTALDAQRLSQVWLYHGVEDFTEGVEDSENYKRLSIAADLVAEGENEYDQQRILTIYQPWLGQTGDDSIASVTVQRMLSRYRDTPQEIVAELDIKDQATAQVADLIRVVSNRLQDASGASVSTQMQITQVQEIEPNHRVAITAESYVFDGRFGFITEDARTDYSSSDAAQKAQGTYIVSDDNTLQFNDGTDAYRIF